jgi:hypothetical protein
MTPQSGNDNGQLKMVLAFVLGIGVAGIGAWMFSGRSDRASDQRIAVAAPASEVEPVASTPAEPEPAPAAAAKRRPSPVAPAPTQVARNLPAKTPAPATSAETPKSDPAATEPKPSALPEVVRRDQPRLDAVPPPPAAPPPPPAPSTVTIKAGTVINVRLAEKISTETHKNNDTFSATLAQPLVVDGMVIAERNARVQGRVVQAERAGKVQGVAALSLELTQITTSDGQKVAVNTAPFVKQGDTSKKDDAKKVAIGSAVGAAIGAIAGGGKGAAIGAGAGAGAGGGAVLMTRGKDAELNVETLVHFTLSNPVTITEKL